MNSKQIDEAMKNHTPVFYNGVKYRRILEYISWYDDSGNHKLSVVLLPMQDNCTVRVLAEQVTEERGDKI